jgi:hypothetical protein
MAKLTAYEIYKKAQKESLTDEQYKQLLIDNDIIIKKVNQSVCSICHGTGYYFYGGSFGGASIKQRCHCQYNK